MPTDSTTVSRAWIPTPCAIHILAKDATLAELLARLGPHVAVYIDDRPGWVHLYDAKIAAFHRDLHGPTAEQILREVLLDLTPESELTPEEQLLGALFGMRKTRETGTLEQMIERGLPKGRFRDTTRVAEWLGASNEIAKLTDRGLPQLTLLIVHAETHIALLSEALKNREAKVAGLIWSGSPKMIDEVKNHPVIQACMMLILFGLEKNIPMLGICFGLHLMALAAYQVQAKWLRAPHGFGYQYDVRLHKVCPVPTAADDDYRNNLGRLWQVYGRERVRREEHVFHPVMHHVSVVDALEVHSMGLLLHDPDHAGLPRADVLATSRRLFLTEPPTVSNLLQSKYRKVWNRLVETGSVFDQVIVEVLRFGPNAIGTQLHPELDRDLLYVLTFLPEFFKKLKAEGKDVGLIRHGLIDYPAESYFAGQRVGYNFVKRVLAVAYVKRLQTSGAVSLEVSRHILGRLLPEGVNYWS